MILNLVATVGISTSLEEWGTSSSLWLDCQLFDSWETRDWDAYGFSDGYDSSVVGVRVLRAKHDIFIFAPVGNRFVSRVLSLPHTLPQVGQTRQNAFQTVFTRQCLNLGVFTCTATSKMESGYGLGCTSSWVANAVVMPW